MRHDDGDTRCDTRDESLMASILVGIHASEPGIIEEQIGGIEIARAGKSFVNYASI